MLKCIKTIRSYSGHARWLAEVSDKPIAWLANVQVADIPSPYHYSPAVSIWDWSGRKVICRETAHRCYQVFEVPAEMQRFEIEQQAEDWHIRELQKASTP